VPRSTVLTLCCAVASAAAMAGAQPPARKPLPVRPVPTPERTEMERTKMERSLFDAAVSRIDLTDLHVDLQGKLDLFTTESMLKPLSQLDFELAASKVWDASLFDAAFQSTKLADMDLAWIDMPRIDMPRIDMPRSTCRGSTWSRWRSRCRSSITRSST
jgi:hypothetical protein